METQYPIVGIEELLNFQLSVFSKRLQIAIVGNKNNCFIVRRKTWQIELNPIKNK